MKSVFEVAHVSHRYAGQTTGALTDISLGVPSGALVALLGPNGSGKSTLLRIMLGELSVGAGTVRYEGRPLLDWKRREIARRVAFVPQSEPLAFPMRVRDLVEMGRYPHVGILGRTGAKDREAVEDAMRQAGVDHLAHRATSTLSGGERQRARIARALAQEPATLVLDEPTAALDLHYEMETFELMRAVALDHGVTVVVATHNLNIAARYATHVVLLNGGRLVASGSPWEVYQRERMETVYGWPVDITEYSGSGPDRGAPQVVPLGRPRSSSVEG